MAAFSRIYFATIENFYRADWVMLLNQEEWSYLSNHKTVAKLLCSAECIQCLKMLIIANMALWYI